MVPNFTLGRACTLVALLFHAITTARAQPADSKVTYTIDIITTPAMVFIPMKSNLPNYLITTTGKTELIGIQFERIKPMGSMNQSFHNSFFSMGASVRAIGLNWRKNPFNHARENDIIAGDLAYLNVFLGGKFRVRNFERGAFNFNFGPGVVLGPAVQNDNVKSGVFTTFGLDVSMTFSYDLTTNN